MLSVNNLSVSYHNRKVLNNVSFEIKKGTLTAVIGKNGSGKSSLICAVSNQIKYSGDVFLNGKDISHMTDNNRAKVMSVLPQKLNDTSFTVKELVTLGRNPYIGISKRLSDNDKSKVDRAMSDLGISELSQSYVDRLSGGERQKAYIAMILAQDTDLIILDEPTSFMDAQYSSAFMSLLMRLKSEFGKTIIVVLHDITDAVEYADDILIIDNGKKVFFGTSSECIQSGILEDLFNVRRIDYLENGTEKSFYK